MTCNTKNIVPCHQTMQVHEKNLMNLLPTFRILLASLVKQECIWMFESSLLFQLVSTFLTTSSPNFPLDFVEPQKTGAKGLLIVYYMQATALIILIFHWPSCLRSVFILLDHNWGDQEDLVQFMRDFIVW